MKKLYIYGLMVCGFAACKPNIEPASPESGDANFSNYVAVGASYTSGFTDGSLYLTGQLNSFPNILATQFKTVGGGEFKQPLVPGEHGWPVAKKILDYRQGPCDTQATVSPVDFRGALDTVGTSVNRYSQNGPYNNLGVAGIRAIDFLARGYAMANPHASRFFKDPAGSRPIDQISIMKHSFFTLWAGGNDVLGYAVAGGGDAQGNIAPNSVITDYFSFDAAYDSLMNTVTRNGAKGVVLNIPRVLELPFFTTIKANGLSLKADDVAKLNLAYNHTQVTFTEGANYFVIEDPSAGPGFRQLKKGEYVLLTTPADSIKCAGWGSRKPIPAQFVLTSDEVAKINNAVGYINEIIRKHANTHGVPVVDIQNYMTAISQSVEKSNGVAFNLNFVSGNTISLDGIHTTGRGSALIANKIIEKINSHYGATIPYADVNKYESVRVP